MRKTEATLADPKRLVKPLATFFYIGNTPLAPGTLGSLAGLFIAWFLNGFLIQEFMILSFIGFLISRPAVEVYGTKDPRCFVLDEVCGMILSVLWVPLNPIMYLLGFTLFRIFDSVKPWPISLIQKSEAPTAIMWDDLAAGFFVNLLLQILNLYAPLRIG